MTGCLACPASPEGHKQLPQQQYLRLTQSGGWWLESTHCCPQFRRFQRTWKEFKLLTDFSGISEQKKPVNPGPVVRRQRARAARTWPHVLAWSMGVISYCRASDSKARSRSAWRLCEEAWPLVSLNCRKYLKTVPKRLGHCSSLNCRKYLKTVAHGPTLRVFQCPPPRLS